MTVSVCQLIFYGRITENSAAGVSAVSCLHFDLRKKADAFLHHLPPPPACPGFMAALHMVFPAFI